MATYLLLRSNKQQGPFSKEQLLQLGLKPYDLIWVEGKSAAWRYPSELSEFKDYAPSVEEQPYDRFYKKTNEDVAEEKVIAEVKVEAKPEVVKPEPVYVKNSYAEVEEFNYPKEETKYDEIKYEKYMPQKKVSVIMPKPVTAKKSTEVSEQEPVFNPTPAFNTKTAAGNKEEPKEPTIRIVERPVDVETKYSQPLDEIKEMYIKQLQQRKKNTAHRKFIIQLLKKVAVFVMVIGAGVLIGFAIKPKNTSKNKTQTVQTTKPLDNTAINPEATQPEINNSSAINPGTNEQKKQPSNVNVIPDNEAEIKKTDPVERKPIEEKSESAVTESQAAITNDNGERNKTSRSNSENESNEKIFSKEDISKLVFVKSNDYKLGAFGGIRNLELTVINSSKFALDNVMVELQYLKINDQPVKVKYIPFQSISPNGSLTIRVPDNYRGAKITYKIVNIESKDNSTTSAGL